MFNRGEKTILNMTTLFTSFISVSPHGGGNVISHACWHSYLTMVTCILKLGDKINLLILKLLFLGILS